MFYHGVLIFIFLIASKVEFFLCFLWSWVSKPLFHKSHHHFSTSSNNHYIVFIVIVQTGIYLSDGCFAYQWPVTLKNNNNSFEGNYRLINQEAVSFVFLNKGIYYWI